MDKLFAFLGDFQDPRVGGADSFCDRLSGRYTVFYLILFAVLVTTKHYVGEPISCWAPPHFTSAHVDYTNKAIGLRLQALRKGGADSVTDQLSYRYTTSIFLVLIILVVFRYLIKEPIECYCPPQFTDSMVDFTNTVCWTTNTYYLPFEDEIPDENSSRKKIGYYQWIALILSSQAFLFYLPRPLWRLFNKKSGISVCTITDAAIEMQRKMDSDDRDKTLRYMTKHMGKYLLDLARNHLMADKCKSMWYAFYGNYLNLLYLVVKCLYIGNVIGQLFLLNLFLGTDYHMYGLDVMQRMMRGEDWTTSDRFPRVTLCDFKIRVLGNIHRYTVQCSLPMNLFNEIIFIFIWFWFVFVAAATTGSLLMWIFASLYWPYQKKYVHDRLVAMEKIQRESDEKIDKFVTNYLRRDGLFIIRLVSKNSSDLIAAELLCGLWDHYKDHQKSILRLYSEPKDEAVLVEEDVKPT